MRRSYLVLRGDVFHFRIRVPADLWPYFPTRELRLSLAEGRCREAQLKASVVAFNTRRFFHLVRQAMTNLSEDQIKTLVAQWRARMVAKDSEFRAKLEVGLGSMTLEDYAHNCDAISDVYSDLWTRAAGPMLPVPGGNEREEFSDRERMDAFAKAAEHMTEVGPESDEWVSAMTPEQYAALDELSRRRIALAWLAEASGLYAEKHDACYQVGARLTVDDLPQTTSPAPVESPTLLTPPGKEATPVLQVWNIYKDRRMQEGGAWKRDPESRARLAITTFCKLIGNDTPIGSITRADCLRYAEFENFRSKRTTTGAADEDIHAIEAAIKATPPAERTPQARHTVSEYLNRLATFFNYAVAEHYIDRSPAVDLPVYEVGDDDDDDDKDVDAWSPEEIQQILSPQNLSDFISKRGKTALSPDRWTYFPWFVVLSCYLGCRRSELAGVLVGDVVRAHKGSKGETPVVVIKANQFRRLKSKAGARCVPIHPDLATLGLWELVEARKDAGAERLFWDPPKGTDTVGKAITTDFAAYTKHLKLYIPRRKVLHSFRHTFRTVAKGAMSDDVAQSLIGHAPKNDPMQTTYSDGLQVPRHEHAVLLSKMDFGLDLDGLKTLLATCR